MLKLGFVSAILPELSLREVFQAANELGYDCVEVMCWPVGKAERRYSGVTHIDCSNPESTDLDQIRQIEVDTGVVISALSYYPNPLSPDGAESNLAISHIKKVIEVASKLGVGMNTFVGRDWHFSVAENWPKFLEVWRPIIHQAEQLEVMIGIENCPMFFTKDEWPGGKNLATSPSIWRQMFEDIPSSNFGLNFDPSHFILQHMDYLKTIREFSDRFYHVHAKDARIDREKLDQVGVFAHPNEFHTPKLPGMGDVDWGRFFSHLTDSGYSGPVCVEVEDRAFEGSLEIRLQALKHSHNYLRQFIPK